MAGIARALISVSDKRGVVELAQGLAALGAQILSTGGTARTLREAGVAVTEVSEYTGFPEMLDGRVKTLHPKIHGGILGRRDLPEHKAQMERHGILPIDLVAVNLYPFEAAVRKPGVTLEEAVENMDIGGPSMVRSAAKNFQQVVVLVDPEDYPRVLRELREKGDVSPETRLDLARKAFQHTARYDSLIAAYLDRVAAPAGADRPFPRILSLQLEKVQDLRYGENPHQRGSFYRDLDSGEPSVATARQLQGKALSFNNVLDANAALELVKEFEAPTAAIIKHNNPCGVGTGDHLVEAYQRAFKTDPVSAFGGVIAFNRRVDLDTAVEVSKLFVEVIVAPGFDPTALEVLAKKKNLRLLETGEPLARQAGTWDLKRVVGGLLVQDRDLGAVEDIRALRVVTRRTPTPEEYAAMAFAWKVCKHVRSNAIVYAAPDRTLGVGAGQMSRVDSARLAILKAQQAGLSLKGAAMASDAFFPFPDGVDVAAEAGITAVIQPGGSVKDAEVIAAADAHGMSMVFTGMRHFRH